MVQLGRGGVSAGRGGGPSTSLRRFRAPAPSPVTTPQASKQFIGDEIQDLRVNFELYGKIIPKLYGNGSVILETLYARDIERTDTTTSSGGSGKGGGSSGSSSTSTEYRGIRIMQACEAKPGAQLAKLEFNGKIVYDATSSTNPTILAGLIVRFHPGGPDETVDPILVEDKPENRRLAYKHLCTIAIEMPLSAGEPWPSIIEATILENDSTATARSTITSSKVMNSDVVFDWANGRYWRLDPSGGTKNIIEYSIADNVETSCLPIDDSALDAPAGNMGAEGGVLAYIPSVNRIMGAEIAGAVPNGHPFWMMDPDTGLTIQAKFLNTSPGDWFTRYMDIEVSTALGVVEAYLFGRYDVDVTDIFYVSETDFELIYEGTENGIMTPGPQFAGSSIGYICEDDEVWEFEVKAGSRASNNGHDLEPVVVYTATANIINCYYDATDGGMVLWLLGGEVFKILVDDWSTILWTSTHAGGVIYNMDHYRIINRIGFATTNTLYVMDVSSGIYTSSTVTTGIVLEGIWDDFTSSYFQWTGNNVQRSQIGGLSGDQVLLRDILSAFMLDNGYEASDFDFSAVPDLVNNMIIKEESEVDAILYAVANEFGLDLIETDKIYLIPVPSDGGLTSSTTIEKRHFIGPAKFSDEDDIQVPRKVEFSFLDPDQRYKYNTISVSQSQFPSSSALTLGDGTAKLRAPIGMEVGQATTLSYKFLNRRRVNRRVINVDLGLRNLPVAPANQITLDINDVDYLVHTGRQSLDPDSLTLETECRVMLEQVTGDVDGAVGVPRPQVPRTDSVSTVFPVNAPLMKGTLDQGGNALVIYAFMASLDPNSRGSRGLISIDAGITWDQFAETSVSATHGVVITPPAAPLTPFSTDYINTLKVRVLAGAEADLTSVTYSQALAGSNAILIGRDGRWEVMKVETWTDNGDGTFTGSGLHRSHLGSEFDTGTHIAGDKFFVIRADYMHPIVVPLSTLGNQVLLRAVGLDSTFDSAIKYGLTVSGRAEKPNAPVQATAVINSTDIDLDWVRQTRGDGAWIETTDNVPLLDLPETYDIDIKDGPAGTVVNTFTVTTSSYKYLNVDLVADLGLTPAAGEEITYEVFQVNAVTGRGFGREVTITL